MQGEWKEKFKDNEEAQSALFQRAEGGGTSAHPSPGRQLMPSFFDLAERHSSVRDDAASDSNAGTTKAEGHHGVKWK